MQPAEWPTACGRLSAQHRRQCRMPCSAELSRACDGQSVDGGMSIAQEAGFGTEALEEARHARDLQHGAAQTDILHRHPAPVATSTCPRWHITMPSVGRHPIKAGSRHRWRLPLAHFPRVPGSGHTISLPGQISSGKASFRNFQFVMHERTATRLVSKGPTAGRAVPPSLRLLKQCRRDLIESWGGLAASLSA